MTTEQNLIAALKEAIREVKNHNCDYHHRTDDAMIEKWLAIRVTCSNCDGVGLVKTIYPVPTGTCPICKGWQKVPLSEVI